MGLLVLILFLEFILGAAAAGGPYFYVAAPDMARFKHEETVAVGVFGSDAKNVAVSVSFQYGDKVFSQNDIVVQDEEHPEIVRMTVTEADIFGEETTDKPRSIKLKASCTYGSKEVDILLNYHTGFLIVQTDKPIYSPRDSVKVRVLPLTEDLHDANTWPLTVDIKSPSNLTMARKRSENDKNKAFFQHSFELPPRPELGIWTVKAYYGGQYETETLLPFEVAEYVLPTYGVGVVVTPAYILPDTPDITVIVTSKYVYGKPVKGTASVTLRLKSPGRHPDFILSRLPKQLSDDEGSAHFKVDMADIRQTPNFPFPWFPDQSRLSIIADVFEQATGNVEKVLHESTLFSTHKYIIRFERSKKYFRPGFQYYFKVDVTYPNGEKAVHTDIRANLYTSGSDDLLEFKERSTDEDGQALFLFFTENQKGLDLKVVIDNEVSDLFTVQAYDSANQIRVEQFLEDNHEMILNANNNMKLNQDRFTGMLFTVWTRGILKYTKFFPSTSEVGEAVDDELQQILTPSARLIAFYVDKATDEVVADSTKFQVEKRCRGKGSSLSVKQKQVDPGEADELTITGVPAMKVGLSIMDKALLLLNDKNVLRKHSMYKVLESHDLGCGEGSGSNVVNVFQNAGVTVLTNANLAVPQRQQRGCSHDRRRKRRSSTHGNDCNQCCRMGLRAAEHIIDEARDDPTLHCYSVYMAVKASRKVNSRCSEELYKACFKEILEYLKEEYGSRSTTVLEVNDYFPNDGDTPKVRTDFRESWLFKEVKLDDISGEAVVALMYPDSITEWMIQAIGVSPDKGICISDPYNVTAFRDFFIQMDLPYQAVRYEHIDIKTTVFHYGRGSIEVSVYLQGVDHLCSNTNPGSMSKPQTLIMEPNSAQTILFPVVPLKAGKLKVTVMAGSTTTGTTVMDAVEKDLHVVNEGIEERIPVQMCIDPGQQREDCENNRERVTVTHNQGAQSTTVDLTLPLGAIPGTGFATAYLTSSNVMDTVVHTLVQGVDALFRYPAGCAEQTIIRVAPTVYAMHYLKQTKQVNEAIEVKGNSWIRDGLAWQLTYRKFDGSYGAWNHTPSSTWLTSFVSKVFCQVHSTIESVDVDEATIVGSLQWLTQQQHLDGSFFDPHPVYHREMIGQLSEGDYSLTAFVLISMLECGTTSQELENSVNAAKLYLEGLDPEQLQKNPYHLALVTYALAKANSAQKHEFNRYLKLIALHDGAMTYWGHAGMGRASANAIETTAYGLLAQLEFDDIRMSSEIVRWLVTQRDSGGAFSTTQATVIGLQALSEYNIRTFSPNVDLEVKILIPNRSPQEFKITNENMNLQKIVKNLPVEFLDNKFKVEVTGTGSGIMVVDLRYNRAAKPSELCRFDISEVQVKSLDSECGECECADNDVIIADYDMDVMVLNALEPQAKMANMEGGKFGRKRRAVRKVRATSPKTCISFTVSTIGDYITTGMSIVNFGLATGMEAVEDDLKKLKDDGVIDMYEMPANGKAFIVFYLDNITNQPIKFNFRLKDTLASGNTGTRLPAAIRVYDYYNPDSHCTAFYGTGTLQGPSVNFKCEDAPEDQAQVCSCVQSTCAEPWEGKLKKRNTPSLFLARRTCQNTFADYAVLVTIGLVDYNLDEGHHFATATVLKVFNRGIEDLVRDSEMTFYWKMHCQLTLEAGKKYYIIAKDGHVITDENEESVYRYDLMDVAVVLEMKRRCKRHCRMGAIQKVYEALIDKGCQT